MYAGCPPCKTTLQVTINDSKYSTTINFELSENNFTVSGNISDGHMLADHELYNWSQSMISVLSEEHDKFRYDCKSFHPTP